MKIIKLFLIFVITTVTIYSCKKGEDDPFLTLRTRKARITGDWKLSSGTSLYTHNDTTETATFSGTDVSFIIVVTNTGTTTDGPYHYTERWSINKDYTFEIVKNYLNYKTETSGYWSFYNRDKDMRLKNKEAIIFRVTSKKYIYSINGYDESNYSYSGVFCPTYLYFIDQLKNKELIINYKGGSDWTGFSESGVGTFTFTQEKK